MLVGFKTNYANRLVGILKLYWQVSDKRPCYHDWRFRNEGGDDFVRRSLSEAVSRISLYRVPTLSGNVTARYGS